jgi:hypothetical protein
MLILKMSNYQEILNFICKVCDDVLRGLVKRHQYGYHSSLVVMRRLDCITEPHKDYYGDRIDFCQKVMNSKVFPMIIEGLFRNYGRDQG